MPGGPEWTCSLAEEAPSGDSSMPGVSHMSQESWKQVRPGVLSGIRRKKSRHKLSLSKLCSCMTAQSDDSLDNARPYEKKESVR